MVDPFNNVFVSIWLFVFIFIEYLTTNQPKDLKTNTPSMMY